jgi:hypothetical protein
MTASMPPVAPTGNVSTANPQIVDDSFAEYDAVAELSVRLSKLATTLPSPRSTTLLSVRSCIRQACSRTCQTIRRAA